LEQGVPFVRASHYFESIFNDEVQLRRRSPTLAPKFPRGVPDVAQRLPKVIDIQSFHRLLVRLSKRAAIVSSSGHFMEYVLQLIEIYSDTTVGPL
jgi:hypothetical protein